MTLFSKFNFEKHGDLTKKDVEPIFEERARFYKRIEARKGDQDLTFDIYIPKERKAYDSIVLNVVGEKDSRAILEVDEEKTKKIGSIPPETMENGAAFLETKLISQPCSIQDGKIRIFKDDLKNLRNLTNQPLMEESWRGTGTGICCPYCCGYYYLDPAKPLTIQCPYCLMTKAEAEKELKKWDEPYYG